MIAGNERSLPKRVIMVLCDGLGYEWLTDENVPFLMDLKRKSVSFEQHQAIFPSVTRVSAATVATGCFPGKHGLYGNQMALYINDRLEVFNAGAPGFRDMMRNATGTTLKTKTLAQYLSHAGGQIVYSNVSPGAAYFLDPEHYGDVYHRAGSYERGGKKMTDHRHLDVSHDLKGDFEMTNRFCHEIVRDSECALGILWLANPDLTLHYKEPGSQEHLAALKATDQMVAMVNDAVMSAREDQDILLIVASDHGHEVIGNSIHLGKWLSNQGLENEIQAGQICIAGQGTSALIYATEQGKNKLRDKLDLLKKQEWVSSILDADELDEIGLSNSDHLVYGIDMARTSAVNDHGVIGAKWMIEDGEASIELSCGQHGGLGPQESHPFIFMNHAAQTPKQIEQPTCLIDIAPTILGFLGISRDAMDGRSLFDW